MQMQTKQTLSGRNMNPPLLLYYSQLVRQRIFFPNNLKYQTIQLIVMFQNNVENQHLECLKLDFQDKTRVSKSRFVSGGRWCGNKVHVELKFLRLEFHHFISLILPCVCSCSFVFFVAGVLLRRSTQHSSPAGLPTQRLFVFSSDILWVLLFAFVFNFFRILDLHRVLQIHLLFLWNSSL